MPSDASLAVTRMGRPTYHSSSRSRAGVVQCSTWRFQWLTPCGPRRWAVPCGQSRQTVERSELRGWAAYGYCASHSRHFWGLRLYLLCAPDGMPISFCLAPANAGERDVAAAMLERARAAELLTGGQIIVADKGFSGEFEQIVSSFEATLVRPDRKNEKPRFGKLGGVRQWIESIYNTTKDQLNLEQHGGRIPEGVWVRVCQRVLALAAGVWHSWLLWEARIIDSPGRHFINYDH